jgi:hypothetical protein
MNDLEEKGTAVSRRMVLTGLAGLVAGCSIGPGLTALAASEAIKKEALPAAPPLPWKWVTLDPLEVGRRAYRNYAQGGCGYATYLAFLSSLKEKVGYPYTTLPEMMMIHAGSGYGGHGTLCGALGGTALIINLVTYDEKKPTYKQMIDRLFDWYAVQEFPTNRFDDISSMPGQVKARAMSPLCHTSVSKWSLTAGAQVTSKAKMERCAKVAGEVAYTATLALNEYFDGKWIPPVWKPSKAIEHCIGCHGPGTVGHESEGMNNQQGHMECLMCHQDHTKTTTK